MTIDEEARLHRHELARPALDESAADTPMNALPPDPDRFLTKDDLAVFSHDLRAEILSGHNDLLRTLFLGMIASNAALVGLVFAAVRLG